MKNQKLTSVSNSCDGLLEVASLHGFRRHWNGATSEPEQGFYVWGGHSIGHSGYTGAKTESR
jgi:hypothetical protein